jgi:drug/metabolite transporter (DMT)-like permease
MINHVTIFASLSNRRSAKVDRTRITLSQRLRSSRLIDVLFGLSVALGYGTADFAGGLTSKRLPTQWALLMAQTLALPLSIVFALLSNDGFTWRAIGRGALAGIASGIAFSALYRGLAIGPMGVVGALASGMSAAIPVAVGIVGGERFQGLGIAGLILVLAAGLLVAAAAPKDADGLRSLLGPGLGLIAGITFGIAVVALAEGKTNLWRIPGERIGIASFVAISLLLTRPKLGPLTVSRMQFIPLNVLCDVGATFLLIESARRSSLSLTGALQSLFPLVTAILAAVFLRERMLRVQVLSLGLAVLGAVFLGLG